MRVGIVTPRYPPHFAGGGEASTELLAEQLHGADRVDEVVVFSFDGSTTETRNGIEVRRLHELSPTVTEVQNVRAYRLLSPHVDGFDVLHAYNMELHPTVGALSTRRSPATVATLNSYHFLPKSVSNTTPGPVERLYELVGHPTTGRVMTRLMNRIDAFVAISSAVRDIYGDHGVDRDRIEVIPNMVDPSFSPPETEDGEGTTVLYVGELSDRKGVSDLVRAVGSLPGTYDLRVVGDGPLSGDLRRLARDIGVRDRVTFTGRVDYDRIPEQYALADVFVHPGVWPEPFGRTVLEAMQTGLPVVCTDVGGPADVVRDPELRVPARDPDALAAAIDGAATDREGVGERNRRYVAEEFSPGSVASRIVDLYEGVVR
ncbi:glycosyltransferase family 1 protein [Halobacteriales archaeon QS_9_68_17]|nr:MAG: glycosyltransferase family 1 protein [Halobacteriales archaeon QS_9_68_17]